MESPNSYTLIAICSMHWVMVVSIRDLCSFSELITPRACARGKAIGVCLFDSVCLGVIATCKYHYSVGKVGKRTYFGLLGA